MLKDGTGEVVDSRFSKRILNDSRLRFWEKARCSIRHRSSPCRLVIKGGQLSRTFRGVWSGLTGDRVSLGDVAVEIINERVDSFGSVVNLLFFVLCTARAIRCPKHSIGFVDFLGNL